VPEGEAESAFAKGVAMTLKSAVDTLAKLGVTEIETATFDPNLHNAVMHVEDETLPEGAIVEVFQKGYKKDDRVIRYAMVKVAN
jgi:molecular chaperone GrpE